MKDGGLILWNAIVICVISKTSWHTEKLHLKDDLENHSFKGPIIPFEAMVEYHPNSTRDRSHQCGRKVLLGILLGCELIAGGIWKGDCSVTVATDSQSVVDRDAVATALRRNTLVWEDSGCRKLWKTGNWSLMKWILQRIPLMYAPKRYLEIGFASCVSWLGCTYAAVNKTSVTIPANGIWVVGMSCAGCWVWRSVLISHVSIV